MTPEENGDFYVRTLLSPRELSAALTETVQWAERIWLAYAWASGVDSEHLRSIDTSKLKRVALGVDFCQTDPDVIRKLQGTGALRIIKVPNTVFHPKLLVAKGREGWRAIIGSSNLTTGGFARNVEANVLIHHRGHGEIDRLVDFINELWEGGHAEEATEEWLARYEAAYADRPKGRAVPRFYSRRVPLPEAVKDLDVEWADYFELIRSQEKRLWEHDDSIRVLQGNPDSYLTEIEACQLAFQQHLTGRFEQMDESERKLVAGGKGSKGYFGRNKGAGAFISKVIHNPEVIGRVLDQLPVDGPVTIELAGRLLDEFVAIDRVKMGVATRLLCVKRPDVFLPANNASFERQKQFFGKKPDSPAKYLEMLERVWQMPWCRSPSPTAGLEHRVWRARVAMLDALFYVPTEANRDQRPTGDE